MIFSGENGRLELVADGLSFPTSLTFDDRGTIYVAESGLPFGGAPPGGRIWQIAHNGDRALLIEKLRHPVMASCFMREVSMFPKEVILDASAVLIQMGTRRLSWITCLDRATTTQIWSPSDRRANSTLVREP